VTTIYVAAASAGDICTVSSQISRLLPGAVVTNASSLASEVTGSVGCAAKLAGHLGRWLAVLVLITAFAATSLLTMGTVAHRVARVRHAQGARLANPPDRRPGARRVGGHGHRRRHGRRRPGVRCSAIIAKTAPELSVTVGGNFGQPQVTAGAVPGPSSAAGACPT
jgi:hypothetical protein